MAKWCGGSWIIWRILVLLPVLVKLSGAENNSQEYYTAVLNASTTEGGKTVVLTRVNEGRYGLDSPKTDVKGVLVAPVVVHGVTDRQGCDPHTRFNVPPTTKQWIALLQRGNCTFREKIIRAASHNATAVIIYNNVTNEDAVTMTHPGTGEIVAIMIKESMGKELLSYIQRNVSIFMIIGVGTRNSQKSFSRGSLVFVSISFIVLMIISSAWLIFYFIQKIRLANARDKSQRRFGDAAKKAISKLTTKTVKKGDKETGPDFDHCAVCIEEYKLNDVVRILPCKHVFHKTCVDPWLHEHCTCPMCKLNILKALGIMANPPCLDQAAFDVERLARGQAANRLSETGEVLSDDSLSVEPLHQSGTLQIHQDTEFSPRPGEINIAVTKEWFIIASFGLLSALTLCYMIIKATSSFTATETESD